MTAVSLQNITKTFGSTTVVRDLSLTIADKEFLVLLGPSGCGKTTTMRMIAGLEQPTFGTIAFAGKRMNETPTRERDVAMVFQNYGLYPHMSVERNIGYPLKLRGVPEGERAAAVAHAAARVELTPYLKRMPRELSGGQRQRVALARSIVRTPKVFLMDEPLSNLDAKLRVAMRAEIKHLAHELNVTSVYVTHDQVEAMTLAHRIALMKDGEIQQLATPDVIYNEPANLFVASFIGSPAMNLIPGNAQGTSSFTVGGTSVLLATPQAGAITLGVRAEDIALASLNEADLNAEVFAFELLGESTMVTIKLDHNPVSFRGPRALRLAIGDRIGVRFQREQLYWFDSTTGLRIAGNR